MKKFPFVLVHRSVVLSGTLYFWSSGLLLKIRQLLLLFLVIISCLAGSLAHAKLNLVMEVDVGVWRGSQPKTQEDFDQLKEMGIATLISLQWNKTVEKENEMAKENGIHFMNYPIKANEEIDEATVSKIFRALKNSKKQPIYLHCQFGRDRTGLIFALYRVKVQGWTPKAAYKEWTDMGFDPKFLKHLLAYFVEETGYDPIKKKPALGPGCGRSYGKLSSS